MIRKAVFLIPFIFCLGKFSRAQLPADTLHLSLQQAETIFLEKNLELLAMHYNIQEAEALVRQARVWENPSVSVTDFNLTPPHPDRMFDELPGRPQQFVIGIEQLITTAGKRSRLARMESVNAEIAGHAYQDAIRVLKFELRANFHELEMNLEAMNLLQEEIEALNQLVQIFRQQQQEGNVSLMELSRLQAFLHELRSEYNELRTNAREARHMIKILLHLPPETVVNPVTQPFATRQEQLAMLTFDELSRQAMQNRPDLLISRSGERLEERHLAFQRAMAVPDISIGAAYDRWGGISEGFLGVGVGIDIPIFNRNRGNISAARASLERERYLLQAHEHQVLNETFDALAKVLEITNLIEEIDPGFDQVYEELYRQMHTNFTQRNISLIEFLDFFESYKAQRLNTLDLQFEQKMAIEELNLATGTDVIR